MLDGEVPPNRFGIPGVVEKDADGKVIRWPGIVRSERPQPAPGRLTANPATAIRLDRGRRYVVKGWLNSGDFVVVFGAAGCGKSLWAAELFYRVAQRADRIYGKRVRGGPVLYVCLEGQGGFRHRLLALAERHGPAPDFHLCDGPVDLRHPRSVDEVVRLASELQVVAVVIDTWAQALPGADENSSIDNGAALGGINRIRAMTGATVVVVDHTGWGEGETAKRTRGWSGKWAACDAALHVDGDVKQGDVRVVPRRLKDGTDYDGVVFGSERVDLGVDDDGDDIVAFVAIERDGAPSAQSALSAGTFGGTSKAARPFLDAFTEALAEHGFEHRVMGNGTSVRAVDVPRVREEFKRRYVTDEDDPVQAQDTARKAFRRFLKQLASQFGMENVDGREVMWRLQP